MSSGTETSLIKGSSPSNHRREEDGSGEQREHCAALLPRHDTKLRSIWKATRRRPASSRRKTSLIESYSSHATAERGRRFGTSQRKHFARPCS